MVRQLKMKSIAAFKETYKYTLYGVSEEGEVFKYSFDEKIVGWRPLSMIDLSSRFEKDFTNSK